MENSLNSFTKILAKPTPNKEQELNKLRLKYLNDLQIDPRLKGEKPWVAYFVSLIEAAVDCGEKDLPFIKPEPFSWEFQINKADQELYPIDLVNVKRIVIHFDPDLEVFYADLYVS